MAMSSIDNLKEKAADSQKVTEEARQVEEKYSTPAPTMQR
jgi:hypothetical protein